MCYKFNNSKLQHVGACNNKDKFHILSLHRCADCLSRDHGKLSCPSFLSSFVPCKYVSNWNEKDYKSSAFADRLWLKSFVFKAYLNPDITKSKSASDRKGKVKPGAGNGTNRDTTKTKPKGRNSG